MRRTETGMVACVLAVFTASIQANILITEVMYDPAGANEHEYVELYNDGASTVDLTGYMLSDDPGQTTPNVVTIPGGTIEPGGTAVLVRIDTSRLVENYQNAWGSGINFIGVSPWPIYTNGGDTVALFDPGSTEIASVDYRISNGFPTPNDAASIYILDVSAADPYAGSNWALSQDGVDGAHFGNTPRAADIGSPGFVIPEPTTLVLLGVFGLWGPGRQKR